MPCRLAPTSFIRPRLASIQHVRGTIGMSLHHLFETCVRVVPEEEEEDI